MTVDGGPGHAGPAVPGRAGGRLRATVGALFVVALLVTGCAADTAPATGGGAPLLTGSPPGRAPATDPPAVGASPPTAPAGQAGPFSATDIAWLHLTVAMAERLLPVLGLLATRSTDPAWRRLATRIEAGQHAHLTRARRLLVASGAPATNPHEGHDMPGMVTDEELVALRSATGTAFHRQGAEHLRAHLTQSVRIAAAERQNGAHPATTALAAAVVRADTAELARLDQLDRPPPSGPGRAAPP